MPRVKIQPVKVLDIFNLRRRTNFHPINNF